MKAMWLALAALVGITIVVVIKPTKRTVGKFGEVEIYAQRAEPKLAVFILHDDANWTAEAAEIGESVASDKNLAVIVNLRKYADSRTKQAFCSGITGDLDELNKSLQKSLGYKHPVPAILLGKALGLNVAEVALSQSASETFAGFMAVRSCGEEKKSSYCSVARHLDSGAIQPPFSCAGANRTTASVATEQVISAHRALQRKSWVASIKDRMYSLASLPSGDEHDKDVSIVEVVPAKVTSEHLVVLYSGDGGWATFVQKLSAQFASKGVPVLGINSLKYFWNKKSPEEAAQDLEKLLAEYTEKYHSKYIHLIGFSYGADVVPFIVSRLPAARQQQIDRLTLLSIGKLAEFEVHVKNWVSDEQFGVEILPELRKLKLARMDCIFGEEEAADSVCADLQDHAMKVEKLPGGHFLNWDTEGVFHRIEEKEQ